MSRPGRKPGRGIVLCAALLTAAVILPAASTAAGPPRSEPAAALALLRARCFSCHGATRTAGLDLRTRAAALAGGGRGPALVPGQPGASRLYLAVTRQGPARMPPAGSLTPAEQALLHRWIAAGALYPGAGEASRELPPDWALQSLRRPPLPKVRNRAWARNPIDAFVLARLEAKGLVPAPEADPATLIRRLSFDLTGLPPTPEQVDAFVRECAQEGSGAVQNPRHQRGAAPVSHAQLRDTGAPLPHSRGSDRTINHQPSTINSPYNRLVDRLLASPRYGERWARHWLDVVRFGESQGYERDKVRDHAWRYRDYVIAALNRDVPYERFVREQIAGDMMPDATPETVAATGFLVAGPWDEVGNQQASTAMKARVREEELEDMVAAVGQTFLGLTVNCARCHDHKFDPIPQRDYYRLQAALAGVRHGDRFLIPGPEARRRSDEVSRVGLRIFYLEQQTKGAEPTAEEARRTREQQLAELAQRRKELKRLEDHPKAYAANAGDPPLVHVLLRGDINSKGEVVAPGGPRLPARRGHRQRAPPGRSGCGAPPPPCRLAHAPRQPAHSPGHRQPALAGPLRRGPRPHPQRLRRQRRAIEPPRAAGLAGHFLRERGQSTIRVWECGSREVWEWSDRSGFFPLPCSPTPHSHTAARPWSLKSLHRLIVTSATYRQGGRFSTAATKMDAENRLLWQWAPRRLEAEAARDAMLAVSGQLNLQAGGPGFRPFNVTVANSHFYRYEDRVGPEYNRRSIYRTVVNSGGIPLLDALDCPDPSVKTPRRSATTTPQQALTLLNSSFVLRQAREMASRVERDAGTDGAAQVERAYRLAFGRGPSASERERGAAFVREHGLPAFCRVLLNTSEFLYVADHASPPSAPGFLRAALQRP